jgi:hypothetical protein
MIRLGFAARLFIIFVTSLVALQVLAVATFYLQRSRDTDTALRMPLPDQAAALVELLESRSSCAPPAARTCACAFSIDLPRGGRPPGTRRRWSS